MSGRVGRGGSRRRRQKRRQRRRRSREGRERRRRNRNGRRSGSEPSDGVLSLFFRREEPRGALGRDRGGPGVPVEGQRRRARGGGGGQWRGRRDGRRDGQRQRRRRRRKRRRRQGRERRERRPLSLSFRVPPPAPLLGQRRLGRLGPSPQPAVLSPEQLHRELERCHLLFLPLAVALLDLLLPAASCSASVDSSSSADAAASSSSVVVVVVVMMKQVVRRVRGARARAVDREGGLAEGRHSRRRSGLFFAEPRRHRRRRREIQLLLLLRPDCLEVPADEERVRFAVDVVYGSSSISISSGSVGRAALEAMLLLVDSGITAVSSNWLSSSSSCVADCFFFGERSLQVQVKVLHRRQQPVYGRRYRILVPLLRLPFLAAEEVHWIIFVFPFSLAKDFCLKRPHQVFFFNFFFFNLLSKKSISTKYYQFFLAGAGAAAPPPPRPPPGAEEEEKSSTLSKTAPQSASAATPARRSSAAAASAALSAAATAAAAAAASA